MGGLVGDPEKHPVGMLTHLGLHDVQDGQTRSGDPHATGTARRLLCW